MTEYTLLDLNEIVNYIATRSARKICDAINIQLEIKMLESMPEPQWIPCSVRLPKQSEHKDDMVLVCNENGSVRLNACINDEWLYGKPIAWMPLPEPYREIKE